MKDIKFYMENPMVKVTPKDGDDFSYEFVGQVVGVHDKYLTVMDSNNDCFDVDLDQVKSAYESEETEEEAYRRECGLGPWPEIN